LSKRVHPEAFASEPIEIFRDVDSTECDRPDVRGVCGSVPLASRRLLRAQIPPRLAITDGLDGSITEINLNVESERDQGCRYPLWR